MSEQRIRTIDGKERGLDDAVIDKFASGLRGQLLRLGDPGYDAARKVWNGLVDKRPALIARCAGTSDVVDAVRFAREHDLLVSVRGGGHLIAPQPYTQIQTLFDEAWPPGRRYYNKSSIIRRLSVPAINLLLTYGRALPTALSAIALQQLHGAASRVGAGDTAFPHRYDHG